MISYHLPTCSQDALYARAKLYQTIRQFFADRQVLEVETPILSHAGVTDVYLASIPATRCIYGQQHRQYLQTSPEFAMKRLLANGSGAIYQICKVFRDNEHGRKHNSEFTMLEWYRPQFSLDDLMQETHALLQHCLNRSFQIETLSYKHAFQQKYQINPLSADLQQLKQLADHLGLNVDLGEDRLAYLDLIFSHYIEPELGQNHPLFLTDFPKELASLAKLKYDDDGEEVAARFEVYFQGLELANAYDELIDAQQLRQRFMYDNQQRRELGYPEMPIDEHLLAALPELPSCSGIALGLDRLLMIIMNVTHLDQVIAFPADRA